MERVESKEKRYNNNIYHRETAKKKNTQTSRSREAHTTNVLSGDHSKARTHNHHHHFAIPNLGVWNGRQPVG